MLLCEELDPLAEGSGMNVCKQILSKLNELPSYCQIVLYDSGVRVEWNDSLCSF